MNSPLLKGWQILLCGLGGAALGAAMIYTHIGPGLHPLPPANTPAFRNQQRMDTVTQLANALVQYYKDHGNLPIKLPATPTQICTSLGSNCASMHLVDLGFLTTAGDYIPAVPTDPLGGHGLWGSGFNVALLPGNEVEVTAPLAESHETIQISRHL